MRRSLAFYLGVLGGVCAWMPSAYALSGWDVDAFQGLPAQNGEEVQVNMHPLGGPSFNLIDPGMQVLEDQGQPLEVLTEAYLRSQSLHPFFQLKVTADKPHALGLLGSGMSKEQHYRLTVGGLPVCGSELKSFRFADGALAMIGAFPSVDPQVSTEEWPLEARSLFQAESALQQAPAVEHEGVLKVLTKEACLHAAGGQMYPVWEWLVRTSKGLSYLVRADEQTVHHWEPRHLHAQAEARVYEKNPRESSLATFRFDVLGDGTLTSDYFNTLPRGGAPRALSAENSFNYDPSDPRFAEASVFAHATQMLAWLFSVGYTWAGPRPLELRVGGSIGNTVNNALYQPNATQDNRPAISVAFGDGQILDNLALDSDVVAHELGHHVIFRTIQTTTGESLILHEGLADYFAFAKSGDSCLGESICPINSPACWVQGQCLRTGSNDLRVGGQLYEQLGLNRQPHLQGQLVSGMLFDLRSEDSINSQEFDSTVVEALNYVTNGAGLADFVRAMFFADRELYQGKQSCVMYDTFEERGLQDALEGINCTNLANLESLTPATPSVVENNLPSSNAPASTSTSSATTSRSGGATKGGCGVVGLAAGGSEAQKTAQAWLLAMAMLPLALLGGSRLLAHRERELVPVRSRRASRPSRVS